MRSAVLLLSLLAACSKPHVEGARTIEESEAPLQSAITAADPLAEPQLVSGFYPAEPDGWRWMRRSASLVLLAPADYRQRGAVLSLLLDVPQVVLDHNGPVTIHAAVGGVDLAPEVRSHPGPASYRRAVPPNAFERRETVVEISFDKAIAPNTFPGEDRELAGAFHKAEWEAARQ